MTPIAIEVGDRIPEFTFKTAKIGGEGTCLSPMNVSTEAVFSKRTVVLVGVPGAFTPTCSGTHIPGFIENFEALQDKNVDVVAVVSVNDAFVMAHWIQQLGATDRILPLADGSGEFTRLIGMQREMPGMGMRSKRYVLLVVDGVVKHMGVDEDKLDQASAHAILQHLSQ